MVSERFMANDEFDKGLTAAVVHFAFGALFGGLIFGFPVLILFSPPTFIFASATGALLFGTAAAIWRNSFWMALADNPLFRAWRTLVARR